MEAQNRVFFLDEEWLIEEVKGTLKLFLNKNEKCIIQTCLTQQNKH